MSIFNIINLPDITSSNDYILERLDILAPDTVVVAEQQTNGRGTNGRVWLSPPGNLYFSLYKKLATSQVALQNLSINVGVKVAETLFDAGVVDIGIKWPNDLFLRQKKLGGILIETKNSLETGYVAVVIGLGLNLIAMPDLTLAINQPYTSLAAEGYQVDREVLLARLLLNINSAQQLQS